MAFVVLGDFDDNGMSVQIVKGNCSLVLVTFVHQICDALAAEKTIVVVNDNTTGNEPWPNPFGHLFCRVVYIDVDVA